MGVFGIDPDKRVDVPNGLRRTGVTGGKGIFDQYMNQILFELKANQIWGTESQVKLVPPAATFYTDGSGDRFDKNDVAVVINEDDKILVAHDVTATANHVLDCGGKKVTLEMAQGVTWNLDTFDLTLGGAGDSIGGSIRITQTGTLSIVGNRGLSINSSVDTYSDFVTKNLIINVQSNPTVDADADNIVFVDEFGGGKRVENINTTFDIEPYVDHPNGDLMVGTSEKASHWYQMWIDSAGIQLLVPDLESIADANVLNSLSDSLATFQTDLVQVNDEIFQLNDLTKGFVKSISTENVITIKDADGNDLDLFPLGTESYKIRMLSPVGLGKVKARIGAAFNNSGSNFDDSTYTQIQESKEYSEAAGDFTVTASNWTPKSAIMSVYQTNKWDGVGHWKTYIKFSGNFSTEGTFGIKIFTIGGVLFKNSGSNQALTLIDLSLQGRAADQFSSVYARPNENTINIIVSSVINFGVGNPTEWAYSGETDLEKKPTFHK